ncbi:MAG: magnesium transporter [Chloroflexi bacterium]|nr:magnesium transporter [Chloroflexota bacterium]
MAFLSQLLGRPVIDKEGHQIGRVKDLVVSGGETYPSLRGMVAGSDGRRVIVAGEQVATLGTRGAFLQCTQEEIVPYQPREGDLELARNILDKQIIDTEGIRVVRVNDLQLALVEGQYHLVAVDASFRGLLRRLGLEGVAYALGLRRPPRLIKWEDIDPLPDVSGMKLKVPHHRLARLHPADIGELVSQLSATVGRETLASLEDEVAAQAIAEVEDEQQAKIIQVMEDERAVRILGEMAPDDAADVLGDIPAQRSDALLQLMGPQEAREIRELMAYDEDSAGGLMTPDFIAVNPGFTAEQVIEHLRQMAPDPETAYYIYITDLQNRLLGVISLRDLVVAQPETQIADIAHPDVITVNLLAPKEEVARTLTKYNLLAVPVVDEENHIYGIVTASDAMDVMLPRAWRSRGAASSQKAE